MISGGTLSAVIASTNAAAGPIANINIDSTTIAGNPSIGLNAIGSNAAIRISRSILAQNATSFATSSGGQVTSYGDNNIDDNTTNPLPPKVPTHN